MPLSEFGAKSMSLLIKNVFMRKRTPTLLMFIYLLLPFVTRAQSKDLKIILIRHAEKPGNGDNLNCQGLNRSLALPAVLFKKFGRPEKVYIPTIATGSVTKHVRMLQTVSPFVIKYGLSLNSAFDVNDAKGVATSLIRDNGTILIVWEHQELVPIISYLGVDTKKIKWPPDDFDTIWIVTFKKGRAIFTTDKESLSPRYDCPIL